MAVPRRVIKRRPRNNQPHRAGNPVNVRFRVSSNDANPNSVGVLIRLASVIDGGTIDKIVTKQNVTAPAGAAVDFSHLVPLGPGKGHTITVLVWNRNAGSHPTDLEEVEQRHIVPVCKPGEHCRLLVFEELD